MRSLLFTLWIQSDKSLSATLALLEELAIAQYETVQTRWSPHDKCEHFRQVVHL